MVEQDQVLLDQIAKLRESDLVLDPDFPKVRGKQRRVSPKFLEVDLELILPFGSPQAYSVDTNGNVVGLKLGGVDSNASEVVDLICQFKNLQRLVLYSRVSLYIPDQIALLPLNYVSLGGLITRIPAKLFEKELPLTVRNLDENSLLESILDRDTYTKIRRLDGPGMRGLENNLSEDPDYPQIATKLAGIRGIMISAKNLADPPIEILLKGYQALFQYYAETENASLPLSELKVILVGNGGAGKTSLVKRLTGEKFDKAEKQTHGINIKKHAMSTATGNDIKINYWDFGGQEIMHATHQFFLSKRSVYILVLDGRKDEDPEYWLQHIESFGGDSPIFVVLNKIDEHASYEVNRRFLLSKYKGIVDFHRISCSRDTGIKEFIESLRERLPEVPMLRTKWPKAWFDVKKHIESAKSPFITLEGYRNCCVKHGVSTAENQELLVDFLHDLGIVLHFRDIQLLDTHVLDPRWVTQGVYRIINSRTLAASKGELQLDQLSEALKKRGAQTFEYPPEKHSFLIDLMLKFELCYRVDEKTILIPDLLDIQEPPIEFDDSLALRFVFEFTYLPRSILPRFIVRMHTDIIDGKRWRTGVLLRDQKFDAKALVRADENAKRIYIDVIGAQNRDYFSVLRKALNDIIRSFEKLAVTEYVPLPDNRSVLIEYQELLGYEGSGRNEYFVGKVGVAYDVKSLLNGIESPSTRSTEYVLRVEGNYYAAPTMINNVMSTSVTVQPESIDMNYKPAQWEKIVIYLCAILFFGLIAFLLVRNQPFSDPNLVVALRIILSLFVAALGATIPGLLHVDLSMKGVSIRAAGAFGLFVIAFFATPSVLTLQ